MKELHKQSIPTVLAFIAFAAFTLVAGWGVYHDPSRRTSWMNIGIGVLGMAITARTLLTKRRNTSVQ